MPTAKKAAKATKAEAKASTKARSSAKKTAKKPVEKTTKTATKTAEKTAEAAKTAAKKAAGTAAKRPAKTAAKKVPRKPAKASGRRQAPAPDSVAGGVAAAPSHPVPADKWLAKQQQLLYVARTERAQEAESLKAEADQMALEAEPGDTQFDDESGEGSTAAVDRERDLALSAQARADAVEIDVALDKIDGGTYGACDRCGRAIPKARLEAIPWAALCVTCKSGGLSARR